MRRHPLAGDRKKLMKRWIAISEIPTDTEASDKVLEELMEEQSLIELELAFTFAEDYEYFSGYVEHLIAVKMVRTQPNWLMSMLKEDTK